MANEIPNRLIFSSKSPQRRKRALILVSVLTVLQICLIWPIYSLFSSPSPLIFGFPLSFVWVIAVLVLSFFALFTFFRKDQSEEA